MHYPVWIHWCQWSNYDFCISQGSVATTLDRSCKIMVSLTLCSFFCTTLYTNFWGPTPQEFWRDKKLKIRPDIGELSTLTANILGTNRDIKNLEQTWSTSIPAGFSKKLANFGPLTKKFQVRMLTYSKSTVCVLRMLMHWSSGHVTLLQGDFQPPKFPLSPPNWTYGTGWTL